MGDWRITRKPSLVTFSSRISGGSCHRAAPAVMRSVSSANVRWANSSSRPMALPIADLAYRRQFDCIASFIQSCKKSYETSHSFADWFVV
jgi:hypothetical protein